MQVTTPTKTHQPHEPGTQGSRHAGNHTSQHEPGHTNQGHQPAKNKFAPVFCVVSKSKQPVKVASPQP